MPQPEISGRNLLLHLNVIALKAKEKGLEFLKKAAQTVLTASIAKYRWELKGSIELMTGNESVTPWYLTIGNPYTPWLATNHIIVTGVEIDTSPEVGFNDMPMWLKATFTCGQSRNLGRNEIIKMFNNSFIRSYSTIQEGESHYVDPNFAAEIVLKDDKNNKKIVVGDGSSDEVTQTKGDKDSILEKVIKEANIDLPQT